MTLQKPESNTFQRLFVGTVSNQAEEGIHSLLFNPASGELKQESKASVLNPGFLTLSKDNSILYSANGIVENKFGGVSAWQVDEATGALTLINQQSSMGEDPCYISIDQSGGWLMAANYGSGSLAVFPLRPDGSLGDVADFVQLSGTSRDPARQEGPHAHFIKFGPGGIVFASDLGADKVLVYTLDPAEGKLQAFATPLLSVSPGDGPRHIDFSPSGKFVYVLNELAGSIVVHSFDGAETFEMIQDISTLPKSFAGENISADIHVHPSGRFLYASNRGDFDSVAVFQINQQTGRLSLVQHMREGIVWPRNFALSPDAGHLLVANQNDNSIVTFNLNQDNGRLVPTRHRFEVAAPVSIQFEHTH